MSTPVWRALAIKAAEDTGWELPALDEAEALEFGSARFDAKARVAAAGGARYSISFTDAKLARELARRLNAAAPFVAQNARELDALLREGAAVALSLPDAPLKAYRHELAVRKIEATEVERLVKQRIGQSIFRDALLALWDERCSVTGLKAAPLLRASHAKPWARCESDEERLDPFNGLLLTPDLDALFDGGWITFDDDGLLIPSPLLDAAARDLLLGPSTLRLRWVSAEQRPYLVFHRSEVFRKPAS